MHNWRAKKNRRYDYTYLALHKSRQGGEIRFSTNAASPIFARMRSKYLSVLDPYRNWREIMIISRRSFVHIVVLVLLSACTAPASAPTPPVLNATSILTITPSATLVTAVIPPRTAETRVAETHTSEPRPTVRA
jgi:hypothetical protein